MTGPTDPEVLRLEQLWGGAFGDNYVDRNAGAYGAREGFWRDLLTAHPCERVLEVGCNLGGNLRWIAEHVPASGVFGIDVNTTALAGLRSGRPDINAVWSPARDLPFRDAWFDLVFTAGVLIHQPPSTLPLVMAEMVRCSRGWVLCAEYHADEEVEVPYRGQSGALFKRDYGGLFQELFPDLTLVEQGFLDADAGFDDATWWLFDKRPAGR